MTTEPNKDLLRLTGDIVAAHVGNNSVSPQDIPGLIREVYKALTSVGQPIVDEPTKPEPAVAIKKSVQPDHIVCLEDGKKLKMLKRHLMTAYGMTPDAYRARWGLSQDYPMVAPSYAAQRSTLAKQIGLGRKPGEKPVAKPQGRTRKISKPRP